MFKINREREGKTPKAAGARGGQTPGPYPSPVGIRSLVELLMVCSSYYCRPASYRVRTAFLLLTLLQQSAVGFDNKAGVVNNSTSPLQGGSYDNLSAACPSRPFDIT